MFTREDKKNTSRIFLGLLLYTLLLFLIVGVCSLEGSPIAESAVWPRIDGKQDHAAVMIAAVIIGSAVMWIYYSHMQKKYGLFSLSRTETESAAYDKAVAAEPYNPEETETACTDHEADSVPMPLRKETLAECVFSRKKRTSLRILLIGLCFTVMIQLISLILDSFIEGAFNSIGLSIVQDNSDFNVTVSIPMALYIALIGPFAEELMYRGFLMKGLRPYGRTLAIVVSSIFFALMHGNLEQIPFAFMCGLMLGYIAEEYSIICSTIVHAINNGALSFAAIGLESILPKIMFNAAVVLCVIAAIVAAAVLIIYHRRDIADYIKRSNGKHGAARCLLSVWVFVFVLLELAEVILSITPLKA